MNELSNNLSPRGERAVNNFLSGYNCAQSLVLAFDDLIDGIDHDTLSRLACSFGGGMGRLREVCGACSGSFMILGLLYGYSTPETGEIKKEQYSRVQEFGKTFEAEFGTLICRQLLGLDVVHDSPDASARTKEYYQSRPCAKFIGYAATKLEEYINEHPIK